MKKIFSILGGFMFLAAPGYGATLTISNFNTAGNGLYGIADLAGNRVTGASARGIMGRMEGLSDTQVADKAAAGDITGLNAAFRPFGGDFALDSLGAGAFEAEVSYNTSASASPGFGGSTIYVWLYKGSSRTTATEYFLVRLGAQFPTDPETLPELTQYVFVRPGDIAQVLAGTTGPGFDYGYGSGELPTYRMISKDTVFNVAPVAVNGTLNAYAGISKSGQLSATDANAGDTLTYLKVSDPAKGTLTIQDNGSYSYKAGAGELGADTFTFKVNDQTEDSNIATVTVTIEAAPPNTAPVALAAVVQARAYDLTSGNLTATDAEGDTLTYLKVSDPTSGSLVAFQADGSFTYRPNAGFVGTDSFVFVANDGLESSAPATITLIVKRDIPSWAWVDGDSLAKQRGNYGTKGSAAEANKPGARTEAASASGRNGISYHFGGSGYGEGTKTGALNDLWKYDATTGLWTWLSGGKDVNGVGTYGTLGEAAAANVPGARSGAALWLDGSSHLWLFGGASTATGLLNDLWKYNFESSEWTWVSGGNAINQNGVYGTPGVAAALNTPGSRTGAASWTDASGRLFVFGGKGLPATGTKAGLLNDLWVFDPTTTQWTWLKGSNTLDATGVYGVIGSTGNTFTPGARSGASAWAGDSGNLWLFGGNGRGNAAKVGNLNDLWHYSYLSNEWTWVSGSATVAAPGVYGTQGVPSVTNIPGARAGAAATLASDGGLLLFGGQGTGHHNDLWSFNPESREWTWLKGPATLNGVAVYGQRGVATATSTPGARRGASAFTDASGNFMLFAGTNGANSNNDVWTLGLPAVPVVNITGIENITGTSATVQLSVNANGNGTTANLRLIQLSSGGEETDIALDPVGNGTQAVSLSEALTDLEPGFRYALVASAENVFGEGRSLVRIFDTVGTAPAVVAGFVTSNSTHPESAGAVNLEVALTSPATVPFTLTFEVTGSASKGESGDFTVQPSSETLTFVPGQSSATISVAIRDDVVVDSENVILTLKTSSEAAVTVGASDVHTLTIEDNDGAPVVDTPAIPYLVQLGNPLSLDGTSSGSPVIAYQWSKAGKNIAKATKPVYTLPSVKLTDSGAYTVTATNAIGTSSSVFDIGIVDGTSNTVAVSEGSAISYAVVTSGTGLVFQWYKGVSPIATQTTATLAIAAATESDAGDYTLRITKGASTFTTGIVRVKVYDVLVAPPAILAGTYVGVADLDASAAPLGGRFDVTVTAKGGYTAKLTQGTKALTAKGQLFISGDATAAQGEATAKFVRSGQPNITVAFTVAGNATTPIVAALEGTLTDHAASSSTELSGYRNNWVAKTAPATSYAGNYTYLLELPAAKIGALDLPQGDGFGAITVTPAGTATYVGRSADGGKYTVATIVGPQGHLPFYTGFTPTPGCLTGIHTLTVSGAQFENNSLQGVLNWKKQASDAKSKELAYRNGFDVIALNTLGGKWKDPAAGGEIGGLTDANNNAALALVGGGEEVAAINAFTFSIRNLKTTGIVQTVTIDKTLPNPNSVAFKLISKPAGHFSGTFAIPNTVKTLVRTAAYQGTFVHRGNGAFASGGFFLLAQPPQPGQTVATAPQLSGQVHVIDTAQD